jgi:hypothetical protein
MSGAAKILIFNMDPVGGQGYFPPASLPAGQAAGQALRRSLLTFCDNSFIV